MIDNELLEGICLQLAQGTLEPSVALPALKELTGESPSSPLKLINLLAAQPGSAAQSLRSHLQGQLRTECFRAHRAKTGGTVLNEGTLAILAGLPLDVPAGWATAAKEFQELKKTLSLLGDITFVQGRSDGTARMRSFLEAEYRKSQKHFFRWDPTPWVENVSRLLGQTLPGMDAELTRRRENQRRDLSLFASGQGPLPHVLEDGYALPFLADAFQAAPSHELKVRILDGLGGWPTSRAAKTLRSLAKEPWVKERLQLILVMRFGGVNLPDWPAWNTWLLQQEMDDTAAHQALSLLGEEKPALLLHGWLNREDVSPELRTASWAAARKQLPAVRPVDFVERWRSTLLPSEIEGLESTGSPSAPPVEKPQIPDPQIPSTEKPSLVPEKPVPPPEPSRPPAKTPSVPKGPARPVEPTVVMSSQDEGPSLWEQHLLPFFTDNWHVVTGVLMVIVGSSLLSYYTWEKHWLLRYTLMPGLLGAFTLGLARLGRWLESRDPQFQGTAHLLRGAAVGLLPANFMTVTLLAADPNVSMPGTAVALASLLYVGILGSAVRRWCGDVHPSLKNLLGGTLVVINTVVLIVPLSKVFLPGSDPSLLACGAFYGAFLLSAAAVVRFARRVLTREMAEDEKASWFFGLTLVGTFLEAFLWVHGSLHRFPRPALYAPLVIGAGGLILLVEKHALSLREKTEEYRTQSFLGFAFLLLGAFLGMGDPWLRPIALELAGAAWLLQTRFREEPLHQWIGLTLLILGGASVGLCPGFPRPWWPALGIGMALFSGLLGRAAPDLGRTAARMQGTVLTISTVLAGLLQWHFNSPPLHTAGFLAVIAVLLLRRGIKDDDLTAVHTALAVAAMALPYLGCVDMKGRTFRGNTLAFGLGLLSFSWLALVKISGSAVLRAARSTGLWLYGVLAVTAVAVRVLLEQGRPAEALASQFLLDYGGPALMTAALLVTAYLSRSLFPSFLAAVMTAVLLPEMKMIIHARLPWISWGSGLATSLCSLGLAWAAFPLRKASFLKELDPGDLFNGKTPFPWHRRDHSLFTKPLVAVAVFLALKTDLWNLLRNLLGDGVGIKTAAALIVSGATWTWLAVYLRDRANAVLLTHLGWIAAAAGVAFGYWKLAPNPLWHEPVVITGVLLQVLYGVYRLFPSSWAKDLLVEPMRRVLMAGAVLFAILVSADLFRGASPQPMAPLLGFIAIQLVWHGLSEIKPLFGGLLYLGGLTTLLAWVTPGAGDLVLRFSATASLTPMILYFLGAALLHLFMESVPSLEEWGRALWAPFLGLATAGISLLGMGAVVDGVLGGHLSLQQQLLLLLSVLVFARAQSSGPLVLIGCFVAFVLAQFPELKNLSIQGKLDLLLTPWRVGAFSLALALAGTLGKGLKNFLPRLAAGPFAQPLFNTPVLPFVWGTALAAGLLGPLLHLGDPAARAREFQLITPYLGAAAYGIVGIFWGEAGLFTVATLLLTSGNIHAVRWYGGPWLRTQGLMENHLIALGAAASLLQMAPFRAGAVMRRMELSLGGFILALLGGTYFLQPNLEVFTNTRFLLSGSLAFFSGLYFLRAARRPNEGEAPFTPFFEGVYHYAVVTSIWCAALLIPALRRPEAAFIALGIPVISFYLRAEWGGSHTDRYRSTASFLAFMMCGLFFFRAAFQMVMFPDAPIGTWHYHVNAPWAMLLGLIMLRLRGLCGTPWLGFYGGLAMMAGSYFTLTRWPGMTPFEFPVPSAWCAVALGHFWVLVTAQASPLRAGLQRLSGLDDVAWSSLRRSWGVCLFVATQAAVLWGLGDYRADTHQAAPLLFGAATLLFHMAWVRGSAFYGALGAAELLLALHMDFMIPSYLPKDLVVWVLLAIWVFGLFLRLDAKALGAYSLGMAGAVLGHIFYHHPSSPTGLWAMAAAGLAGALTPRRSPAPADGGETFFAGLLLLVPAWLTYFHQAPPLTGGMTSPFQTGAVLSTLACLFLTGWAARLFQENAGPSYLSEPRPAPRLFHQTLSLMALRGAGLIRGVLVLVALSTGLEQSLHFGSAFNVRDLGLILGLYGASAVAWFHEVRRTQGLGSTLFFQFCVLGFFAVIRRQLMLTTGFWTPETDVWASLAVSALLTGFKRAFDLQPAGVRFPMLGALLALPALAMTWALIHHMGTHVVLMIVGMHSVLFTHLGKDDRESPYNVVAVAGFVSFLLIVFWTKLELRALHAYVIPVGLGVLLLLHLLRERVSVEVANSVRLVTLLCMLGSAGYYALLDPRFPLVFHLTLLILALFAMSLGAWLKVRVYLFLGFTGVLVDLGAILFRVLVHLDRGARMTLIGGQVLALGAALVFGAIYYKTHQDEISDRLNRWKESLSLWE